MRIHPFRGIHFDAPEAGALAAPPYDQIDDSMRDHLHRRRHQFAHLSRPIADGDSTPYVHAANLHDEWLASGVTHEDEATCLYPYEILLPSGSKRLGVTAMVGIEPPATGIIRPHEETLAKAVADRLELLRAMQVDLEPILLLSDDDGAVDRLLAEDVEVAEPITEHEDAAGNRHRLFRLSDAERIRHYIRAVGASIGLIADGHHRYKVAGLYAEEIGASADSSARAKLSVITSLASPELTIDPIHRGLEQAPDLSRVRGLAASRRAWEGDDATGFAAAVAAAPRPALGVWAADSEPEIWTFDPDALHLDVPAARRRLAVVVLHRGIFPALGLDAAADTDGTVVYRSDPEALVRELHTGKLAVAFFLPPMEPENFAQAVLDGGLLPPKSTRFLPKLVSGLVWARHSTPLG